MLLSSCCNLPDQQFAGASSRLALGSTDGQLTGSWADVRGSGTHGSATLYEHMMTFLPGGTGRHSVTISEACKVTHSGAAALTWARTSPGHFKTVMQPAGRFAGYGCSQRSGEMDLQMLGDQLVDASHHRVFGKIGSASGNGEYASAQAVIAKDNAEMELIAGIAAGAVAGAVIGKAAINNPDATRGILDGVTKATLNGATGSGVPGGGEPRYDMWIKAPGGKIMTVQNITAAEAAQLRKAADDIRAAGAPDPYGPLTPTKSPTPPQYGRYKNGN